MSRTKKKEGAVRGKTTNRIINILLSGRYNRRLWRFSLGTADGGQFKDQSSGAVDPQSKSSI